MAVEPGHVNWFGRQLTNDQFLDTMAQEQRLIYEFDILRSYGMYGAMPTSP